MTALEVGSGEGVPAAPPFRLADPLPAGVTLLEASAGTGKTHTIASLAVRYLAEGVPIDQLLVVTFTRSATGELRDRVRARLVAADAGLRAVLAGRAGSADELVALLAEGSAEESARRGRALAGALADFDAATIVTIHGFCEQVLGGLGTAAAGGGDTHFVEDNTELIDQVVDDFFVRKFSGSPSVALSRREARRIVATAFNHRDALIQPDPSAPRLVALDAMRASLAQRGRDEVLRRARIAGAVGYDDQLHRVRDSLTGPAGDVALRRLRRRFAVVLVDEFQDTDPVQWDIFRTAFAGSDSPLLLIGDPKQAIYSFRGADVLAYLRAKATATRSYTLGVNWRTDQPLVDAVNALFAGATLGHPGIAYRPVAAAPGHSAWALAGSGCRAPLRLRVAHRSDGHLSLTKVGTAQVDSARDVVAADLAAEVVGLLASGALLASEAPRTVAPGDLAVLVRTHNEGRIVCRALVAAGVPAVIAGGGSVFATPAAGDWLRLLEALEQPAASGRVRAAALTPFVGWDPSRLVVADDAEVDALQARLHRWAATLDGSGVAALSATVSAETGMVARQLGAEGGERRLTDLRHLGELLHAEALASGGGARSLTAWLRDRMADDTSDTSGDDRSRRLESDDAAVQILTIHRSKGLEYPVVYLPYMWLASPERDDELPTFHDPSAGDRQVLDVGVPGTDRYTANSARASDEHLGEDLRHSYVALTRARHHVVVWWATGHNTAKSSLGRLVLGRGAGGAVTTQKVVLPRHDDQVLATMHELARQAPGCISVERVAAAPAGRWRPAVGAEVPLEVRVFDRAVDTAWRRASFTSLTARAHEQRASLVASEAEHPGLADDESAPAPAGAPAGEGSPGSSAMAGLPAGAEFGILVHSVLEGVDFAAEDLDSAIARRLAAVGSAAGALDAGQLAAALTAVVHTPLGAAAGGLRLRDIARRDRLDELSFELPLAGGDRPGGHLSVADVAGCLRRGLPATDPFAGYPDRLDEPGVDQVLRGYLTGSIDAVFRLRDPAGGERYVVADYKTNWLGPPGETLTVWHYRPERMIEAMLAEHYPLQALLYTVALHRYLRWRLPGYEPDRHLGGVAYLFVRGMAGAATPTIGTTTCGVLAWEPPAGVVAEVSDLFDDGSGVAG